MSKTPLAVADICRIIEACGQNHVVELEFHDLRLKFGQKTPLEHVEQASAPLPAAEIAALERIQKKEAEKALLADEIETKEQQLAMALLEDPMLAEELQIQGELENGSDVED
jgi:hypothetical protein